MLIPSLPAVLFHQPNAKVPGRGKALASFTVLSVKMRDQSRCNLLGSVLFNMGECHGGNKILVPSSTQTQKFAMWP